MEANDKARLLREIQLCTFLLTEANLYLDTHPCDQDALAYFNDYSRMRNDALEEYARLYGPLTVDTATGCSRSWEWINQPWPWQEGGCY